MAGRNIWDEIVINEYLTPFDLLRNILDVGAAWALVNKIVQVLPFPSGGIAKFFSFLVTLTGFVFWLPTRYALFLGAVLLRLVVRPALFPTNVLLIVTGVIPCAAGLLYLHVSGQLPFSDQVLVFSELIKGVFP
jgi:hypothetical protein